MLSVGFMVESMAKLYKVLMHAQHLDQSLIETMLTHYATHVLRYAAYNEDIQLPADRRTSIIAAIGPDLCAHVMQFVQPKNLSQLICDCKTFNKFGKQVIWKSVHVDVRKFKARCSSDSDYGYGGSLTETDDDIEEIDWYADRDDLRSELDLDISAPRLLAFLTSPLKFDFRLGVY
jgi:hypothetical protein